MEGICWRITLWLEVRRIGTGQGSSSIARTMNKLRCIKIEGDDWRAYFDEVLTSWRNIEMPGSWEDKFKEPFTSLFIEGVKTMKDPKLKLMAEITAQMARTGMRIGTFCCRDGRLF